MLTEQDLLRIQDAMREAEKDTTPFSIIDGEGQMAVIGDVNKTELKKYSYTVKFRVPTQFADMVGGGTPIVGGKYVVAEVEYPNVYIRPRDDTYLVGRLNDIRPFFMEIGPDGDSKDRSVGELRNISINVITNRAITNAMYEFVGALIGVDESLIPMMTYDSVLFNLVKSFEDFPELLNEQDFFTGGPPWMAEPIKQA